MQRYKLDSYLNQMQSEGDGKYVLYSVANAEIDKWIKIAGENQRSANLSTAYSKTVEDKCMELNNDYRELKTKFLSTIANRNFYYAKFKRIETELAINAKLLAKQCDLARAAESNLAEARQAQAALKAGKEKRNE